MIPSLRLFSDSLLPPQWSGRCSYVALTTTPANYCVFSLVIFFPFSAFPLSFPPLPRRFRGFVASSKLTVPYSLWVFFFLPPLFFPNTLQGGASPPLVFYSLVYVTCRSHTQAPPTHLFFPLLSISPLAPSLLPQGIWSRSRTFSSDVEAPSLLVVVLNPSTFPPHPYLRSSGPLSPPLIHKTPAAGCCTQA